MMAKNILNLAKDINLQIQGDQRTITNKFKEVHAKTLHKQKRTKTQKKNLEIRGKWCIFYWRMMIHVTVGFS